MPYTVLVTAPRLADAGVRLLEAANASLHCLVNPDDSQELHHLLGTLPVDAVISRTVDLTGAAIDACPTLKVISKHGVGVSNIDVGAATKRGIPVYVTPGANAQSVAELTLGLMFAAARRVTWMDSELRAGRWTRAQDGVELHGRTIGLVGFGQVAQRVARVCLALGMQVAAFDPALASTAVPAAGATRFDTLEALLAVSDVVSLHAPLNQHTRAMIGPAQLACMRHGAILINTARGELVDEAALVAALRGGQLHAAGLDTMAVEPLPAGSPLLTLGNVVLTPHVGGSTPTALAAMASDAVRNVLGYLQGTPPAPALCVNPGVLAGLDQRIA
ncbi:hydroxyacid dehydrogenase [Cupriavidus sp. SK-4]|uniref:hydroxyacid dehydrogenase n=1 Tax=Cupriavidus sp. SK-4 TaxID=574750 RepID=UPI00044E764D|nr:hydroxyacid dehydrogenase [Cupriavidus sp. SK-4]EYS84887.1 hydroxyacid dehydrogenase [Cupriavidus sp. SK-4]